MKKISILSICAIAMTLLIVSCGKALLDYGDIQNFDSSKILLKINYVSAYANNRSVYFKINDQRVSNLLTWRTPFPGGGYNTGGANNSNLLQVTAGSVTLSVAQPHKIDNGQDSIVLYTTTFQAAGGGNYTIHITDTAATTKSVVTQENLAIPDSSVARYRFINLMPNVSNIDLYFGTAATTAADQSTDSLILGNVPYMQISQEFQMKATISKTWKLRPAGAAKTAATLLASYASTSSVLNQRVYTVMACGYNGKTTTAQKPYVSFFLIR
jgi:hypothetical protein